jgi:hypothetical protein
MWDLDHDSLEEWTGDQWEYRRLTELWVKVIGDIPMQQKFILLEDEVHGLQVVDDLSLLGAANRLGSGGWLVRPLGVESGTVPGFLMDKVREVRTDGRLEDIGGRWTRFWLTRERLRDELTEDLESDGNIVEDDDF